MKKILAIILISLSLFSCLEKYGNTEKVSFKLINDMIYIPVNYDGNKYQFILDSGSDICLINKVLFDETNFLETSTVEANDVDISQFYSELTCGNYTLDNIQTGIYDFCNINNKISEKIDGILGLTYLGNFVYSVDFKKNMLLFDFSVENILSNYYDYNFTNIKVVNIEDTISLAIEVIYNNKTYKALIDTGSNNSSLPAQITDQIENTSPESIIHSIIEDNLGLLSIGQTNKNKQKERYIKLSDLEIASDTYNDLYFQVWDNNYFKLGNDFLKHFNWIFDYENKIILFNKNDIINGSIKLRFPNYGFDVYYINQDNIIIKEVIMDSDAWIQGIRPGMIIKELNGVNLSDIQTRKAFNEEFRDRLLSGSNLINSIKISDGINSYEIFKFY